MHAATVMKGDSLRDFLEQLTDHEGLNDTNDLVTAEENNTKQGAN